MYMGKPAKHFHRNRFLESETKRWLTTDWPG